MKLYRYRSIDRATEEIKESKFYYADMSELNDPIEGYVQIYWQGDKPAWEGLFHNYICSLHQSITLYLLATDDEQIKKCAVLLDVHHFDNLPLGKILNNISREFLENGYVQWLINYLAHDKKRCPVKLLRYMLFAIHEAAFAICIKSMKELGVMPGDVPEHYIDIDSIVSGFPHDVANELSDKEKETLFEMFASVVDDMRQSLKFKMCCEGTDDIEQRRKWNMVRLDFATIYVEQLQKIIYPEEYVVCFSSDGANSAMWGNYAQNHTGACLVYETTLRNGHELLVAKNDCGIGNEEVSTSFISNEVKPVIYRNEFVERNFFESLGRLTTAQVESWLVAEDGEMSYLLEQYYNEDWRKKYWFDFAQKGTIKLPDWAYEQEYRLQIDNTFYNYESQDRLIPYDPRVLIGVIFGMKTSDSDKLRIIDAIKASGRDLKNFVCIRRSIMIERRIWILGHSLIGRNEKPKSYAVEQPRLEGTES